MFFSHGLSHVSRVFARFSHDLLFQGFFFARIFARFARFRTVFARSAFSRFFFLARFARVRTIFARRPEAVGQRVCPRFDRNLHKSGENRSFRLAHPKIFEFFTKTNRDQLKTNTSECLVICTGCFCVKTEDSPNILRI